MQRLKYYSQREYSTDELEHIRIHNMLEDHERWSMAALWGFIIFWALWGTAVVVAAWYYWPFS